MRSHRGTLHEQTDIKGVSYLYRAQTVSGVNWKQRMYLYRVAPDCVLGSCPLSKTSAVCGGKHYVK